MPTPDEMTDAAAEALVDAVGQPKRVKGDAGEVEAQSVDDMIRLHQYASSLAAASKVTRGLRLTKLVPDGTV